MRLCHERDLRPHGAGCAACDAVPGCIAFNSNGWLKGCAAASCGAALERVNGTTSWIKLGGDAPAAPVAPVEDAWYPDAAPAEDAALSAALPSLLAVGAGTGGAWALLRAPSGATANVSVDELAFFNFTLVAAAVDASGPLAVLERVFAQWGATVYLRRACTGAGGGGGDSRAGMGALADAALPCGEEARLRRTVGRVAGLAVPNYTALVRNQVTYYVHVAGDGNDFLGTRIIADSRGEPSFLAAAAYITPSAGRRSRPSARRTRRRAPAGSRSPGRGSSRRG